MQFSGMKRLNTPLRSTMSEERLSSLAIHPIHKHENMDIDNVVSESSHHKGKTSFPFPVETISL